MSVLTFQLLVQIPPLDFILGNDGADQSDASVKAIKLAIDADDLWTSPGVVETTIAVTRTMINGESHAYVRLDLPLPTVGDIALYRLAVERQNTAADMTSKRWNQKAVATEEEILLVRVVADETMADAAPSDDPVTPLTALPDAIGRTLIPGVHIVTIAIRRDGKLAAITLDF